MSQDVHIIDLRRSYVPQSPDAFPVTMHDTSGEDNPEVRIPVMPYDGYNFMPTPQGYCSFFGINSKLHIESLLDHEAADAVYEITYSYGDPEPTEEEFKDFAISIHHTVYGGDPIVDWAGYLAYWEVADEAELRSTVTPLDSIDLMDWLYQKYEALFEVEFGVRTEIEGALITEAIEGSGSAGGIDDCFMIQTDQFVNKLIALCDDGIWTKQTSSYGAWTQEIALDVPEGDHREWSKCVIDNVIYTYRQGEEHVWIAGPDNDYVFTEATPTGINMAGQLGIFKAGGRLGFWDSENSTGWSSLEEPLELGDAKALSGFTIFQDIVGRIVNVLQHGDGFIIYCTKSIVWVQRNVASQFLFAGKSIFNNNGISYRREACFADPDTIHFANTTQGICEIANGQASFPMPEISTYLKEKRQPIFLKVLNGRYLHFQFLDPFYVQGQVNFRTELLQNAVYTFQIGAKALTDWDAELTVNPCRALSAVEFAAESLYLYNQYGWLSYGQAEDPNSVPIWTNFLSYSIDFQRVKDWKNFGISTWGDYRYFFGFSGANLITQDDGYGNLLPLYPVAVRELDFNELSSQIEYIAADDVTFQDAELRLDAEEEELNQNDFYAKQEYVYLAESLYQEDFHTAMMRYPHGKTDSGPQVGGDGSSSDTITIHESTWALDRSFHGENNRFYGYAEKSAWLERSFVRIFRYRIYIRTIVVGGGVDPDFTRRVFQLVAGKQLEYKNIDTCQFTQLGYTQITGHGHYEDLGETFVVDDAIAEDPDYISVCDEAPEKKRKPAFGGIVNGLPNKRPIGKPWQDGLLCGKEPEDPIVIDEETFIPPDRTVTIPLGEITLQDGSPEPLHPSFIGAFVFDIQYKKWGKMYQDFLHLLDFFPLNNVAGDGPIPYDTFLPRSAVLLDTGFIHILDKYPEDSYITFGKYGQYRKGFTDLHEIRVQLRDSAPEVSIQVDASLNGKDLETGLTQIQTFQDTNKVDATFKGLSARWYNVTVDGNYDLTNMEIRSSRAGRR